MASTSKATDNAQRPDDVPSVQEQLTEVQRLLLLMRSDCEEYLERDREREEEKELRRAEKEVVWEQLRRDVAQIADERRDEAWARRMKEEELETTLHILREHHRQRMETLLSMARESAEERKERKAAFLRELARIR